MAEIKVDKIGSLLRWLNKKFGKGFYFPEFVKLLSILKKLSFNYWIKSCFKKKGVFDDFDITGKKAPRFVSELYQSFFVVVGVLILSGIKWFLTIHWLVIGFIIFFGYRLFDILIFLLNWIFVDKVPLHQYLRSIAGFFVNLFEIALYVTIIEILGGCRTEIENWRLVYSHLIDIFTLGFDKQENLCIGCVILSCVELFLSVLLLLVVIAALVGKILRGEVGEKEKRKRHWKSKRSKR